MAKKEIVKEKQIALFPVQYWEMREAMEEMMHAKTKAELSLAKHAIMEKNREIDQLKSHIFKETVKSAQADAGLKQKAYEQVREKIEAELGYSLKNKAINEITFEVNDIPEDSKP